MLLRIGTHNSPQKRAGWRATGPIKFWPEIMSNWATPMFTGAAEPILYYNNKFTII